MCVFYLYSDIGVGENDGRKHLMRNPKKTAGSLIKFSSEQKATHKVSMNNVAKKKSSKQEDFLRSLELVRSEKN